MIPDVKTVGIAILTAPFKASSLESDLLTFIPPMYPQAFLFATGRVKDVEYVVKDENGQLDLRTKKVLPVTLIFDHKIGGAHDIIPFIKKLDEITESPATIRTW